MRFLTTLAIGLTIVVLVIVGSNLETIADFLSRFLDGILTFLTALGWFVLVLGSAASVVYLVQFYRSRESSRLRQKDGSFPLRAYTIDGGGEVLLNPNNMIGAASVFHPQHGFFELPSTMPPELQADVRKIIERTHQLQALTPGDDAITSKFGSMWRGGNSGVANAATGRLLAGNYDRPVKALSGAVETATPDPLATPPAPRLALTDALAQSTGSRWIVGQSDNGALATFEPTAHAHAAIVGSTGTGKTRSVGYALALAAIRSGWHVLILDPDGGADWSPFRTHAEWQETDRASFPGQIEAIHRFYERRASLDNPRPVLVVIEEYGDMIRQLRTANRNAADQVDNWLDSILRRGRKRRMHVALIDQYPEHWSQPVIGGTKFRAVFQLGPGQGAKVEEYHAAKLPDVGRFLVRGIEYNSFDASTQAAAVLRQLPAPTSTRRVINGTATRVPASSPVSSPASSEQFAQEVAPPLPAPSEPAEPTGPTDYQKAAAAYVQAFPACTQTDLRHALDISKAYANELWHTHHPKGNRYQLPTGSMDLSNDTDRAAFEQLVRSGAVSYPEPKEK